MASPTVSHVIGLIPTGWYPSAISVTDRGPLYVLNGKSNAGPNPERPAGTRSRSRPGQRPLQPAQPVLWQLHKAGFLSLPAPAPRRAAGSTWQVAFNKLPGGRPPEGPGHDGLSAQADQHVIYVVKENRDVDDQVDGDLPRGNGDPSLAILSPDTTRSWPASSCCSTTLLGRDLEDRWNWTTAARASPTFPRRPPPLICRARVEPTTGRAATAT